MSANAFELYYQPIVGLNSGQPLVIEALLRWPQKDGGMIGPDIFIPLAETAGVINELGSWVIEQACLFCAGQRHSGLPDLRVAVNISALQFNDGLLQSHVERALQQAKLPPEALEIELTESLFINDSSGIVAQLAALNNMGITIAIDDFGSGYSNLAYLRRFNASTLKIDRSFIHPITTDDNDVPLVQAMITMARSLGMSTVAEGIEDEATRQVLLEMGCDYGQGYHWSKPLSAGELGEHLKLLAKTQ